MNLNFNDDMNEVQKTTSLCREARTMTLFSIGPDRNSSRSDGEAPMLAAAASCCYLLHELLSNRAFPNLSCHQGGAHRRFCIGNIPSFSAIPRATSARYCSRMTKAHPLGARLDNGTMVLSLLRPRQCVFVCLPAATASRNKAQSHHELSAAESPAELEAGNRVRFLYN